MQEMHSVFAHQKLPVGSSWWELYKVRFVHGTVFAVVVTSHPNIVQFKFPIILPASNYA